MDPSRRPFNPPPSDQRRRSPQVGAPRDDLATDPAAEPGESARAAKSSHRRAAQRIRGEHSTEGPAERQTSGGMRTQLPR
jgi:hypothetical protein